MSASFALGACALGWETGPHASDVDDGGVESSTVGPDASPDLDGDAGTGAPDADLGDAGPTYLAFDDEANWEDRPLAGSFAAAAFDGRYVYFAPASDDPLWRFDTSRPFGDADAWTSVALPQSDSLTPGYRAAAVAGGKLYLAPLDGTHSWALEYAVGAPFVTSSFRKFALLPSITVENSIGSYVSVVPYDGFVYFVPGAPGGKLARHDPGGDFEDGSSWSSFPWPALTKSDGGATEGRSGAIATSKGIYFLPSFDRALERFAAGNFTTVVSLPGDFLGGTSDGVAIYLAPRSATTAVRFSPDAAVDDNTRIVTFDTQKLVECASGCAAGAIFDGRYVYLVPRGGARFVRFDTRASLPFGAPSAWSVGRPDAGATSFFGGAFDGRYVYFVPDGAGRVVRFHAREPAAMPTSYSGSFW